VSNADVVWWALWAALTLYAILGGADFGAGLWDLAAGRDDRGARPRLLIDRVLTPVWEANHVWLIFMLVITWTAFPSAFASIMSTLSVPLWLAALGIVLRGAGFAFRHVALALAKRRALGASFALSSVLTPFFMGTVAGAIATGRVPAHGAGDRLTSWLNITSIGIGALLVAGCAYIAAVFLVSDARRLRDPVLERYFRVRAIAAGLAAGAIALADLMLLRTHARGLFDDLLDAALPLIVVSALCGLSALIQLGRNGGGTRPLAVAAFASLIWGWAVAQRPNVLPGALTIDQAAAPSSTLTALIVVIAAALAIVGPALLLLLALHQRTALDPTERSAAQRR
jgi:cytochrome d ubiquinol oxidase subunit II